MDNLKEPHSFHIPVMGIGFTIDTPVKVAPYGISSVISLLDDILIEKMRQFYCNKFKIPFQPITDKIEDFRAKRITAYLNLIDNLITDKFEKIKESFQEKSKEFEKYFNMLPNRSNLRKEYEQLIRDKEPVIKVQEWIHKNFSIGSIDVNIMTKLDKANYDADNETLPVEFNDAHAALRGFANSNLSSSVVLSAGMNPKLYSYFEKFSDFYPDINGKLKKKIILKVSDYRSALIQGKIFAKKGLWVSEYRIESGLNCGGHAFATEGNLMGPILEEFKNNREDLINTTHDILIQSLCNQGKSCPDKPLQVKITAQGGVGTIDEHNFLINQYGIDSVGWGTPFLLVPEAVNVDIHTLKLLADAKENDLYLSDISPLGVRFNNLRGNTKDIEKLELIKEGKPGRICTKRYACLNNEFTDRPICTASRQYQRLKINELDLKCLSSDEYKKEYDKIVDKSCICVGLGTSALIVNHLDMISEGPGVSVCPGPNMAYFSEVVSLEKMVDHIYGRTNLIKRVDRPNMFIKELVLYIEYFKERINEIIKPVSDKQLKYFSSFKNNLNEGIEYYKNLFSDIQIKDSLEILKKELSNIKFSEI